MGRCGLKYPPLLLTVLLAGCAAGQSGIDEDPPEWVVLFPDQEWNDYPEDQIETWTGVIVYEATDPLPSYVQRHNPYKLKTGDGTIDIYMGSSDELQGLIGREIEIRGCLETIGVEGHVFVEIWPVEYRTTGLFSPPTGESGPVRYC
jgi:hypothetical protein